MLLCTSVGSTGTWDPLERCRLLKQIMLTGGVSGVLTYDRHSLAYVIEVENGQKLVDDFLFHLHNHDGLRRTRTEHEPEVSSRGDQSALVW